MRANYSSRGYQVYGDVDAVKVDSDTVREILQRQGVDLILEAIANHIGNATIAQNLTPAEVEAVTRSCIMSLTELIEERT